METLEQAALQYDLDTFNKPTKGENVLIPEHTAQKWNIDAFKAGAKWRKEQTKELISMMQSLLAAYRLRYPNARDLLLGYTNEDAFELVKSLSEHEWLQD